MPSPDEGDYRLDRGCIEPCGSPLSFERAHPAVSKGIGEPRQAENRGENCRSSSWREAAAVARAHCVQTTGTLASASAPVEDAHLSVGVFCFVGMPRKGSLLSHARGACAEPPPLHVRFSRPPSWVKEVSKDNDCIVRRGTRGLRIGIRAIRLCARQRAHVATSPKRRAAFRARIKRACSGSRAAKPSRQFAQWRSQWKPARDRGKRWGAC